MPMQVGTRGPVVVATSGVLLLLGLALLGGGAWLLALGGSWFYVLAGAAFLAGALLLWLRRRSALLLHALLVLATLGWSLWEVGLDWWPLAARGGIVFVLGLWLLLPWVTRRLGAPDAPAGATRGSGLMLSLSLLAALCVAAASWITDPHALEGRAPAPRAELGTDAATMPPGDWWAYGRTGHGQRYSPLDQITPETVGRLELAWSYRTGDVRGRPGDPEETTFQVTPLKIGQRLFLCTPHQAVIALDATSGEELWRYDPEILSELALQHLTCRGLSYDPGTAMSPTVVAGEGPRRSAVPLPIAAERAERVADCGAKLFMPTADGRIIALDPETGSVCRNFGGGTGQLDLWANMPNPRPGGYYSTSPVVVAAGMLIVGGTVLDNVSTEEQSGVIRAFDIASGALVWNWDPGAPEATEPIEPEGTYVANSPNAWAILSVDEALGLVYVPLGNQPPDQFGGDRSEPVERYSSSVTALDLADGRVRWSFQTVHHDLWDYDVPAQPTLVDIGVGGETVPALVQPTKQGDLFVLDRRTGAPLLPVREEPVPQGAVEGDWTAPTQPASALSFEPPPLREVDMWGATLLDQLVCRIQFRQLRYEGRYTPPSLQGTLVHPGNFGVFNWGGVAVDPARQIVFAPPASLAFVSRLVPRPDDETLMVQGDARPEGSLPALNENFGAPYAVQLHAFTSPLGLPCQAPPWGSVAAADLTTGEILWRHRNGTVRDRAPIPLPFRMGVPSLGGPLVTAGGVAFLSGTLDYYLRGYDIESGREIWRARLPAGGQATPMTYLGADGRQFVVLAAGGHGSLGTKAGDYVLAFVLPPG